jgi:hypothetical protein
MALLRPFVGVGSDAGGKRLAELLHGRWVVPLSLSRAHYRAEEEIQHSVAAGECTPYELAIQNEAPVTLAIRLLGTSTSL